MLIYNFQKEFVGIDEKTLKKLGYNDLEQLHTEVADFADLFVKTPGFIHNFKHVHWIDYITCAESAEESKVIIQANTKIYKAVVNIDNAYLENDPNQKAYFVHLNNLQTLTTQEYKSIANDVSQKSAPKPTDTIQPPQKEITVIADEHEQALNIEDISNNKEQKSEETPFQTPIKRVKEVASITTKETLNVSQENSYVYDPHVASKELQLPLDLIEEFLQDFIQQANDFKNELYSSLEEENIDNVKILSHKLKGVAANLRIEDAFELLAAINAASDADIIKTNLDAFYIVVAKLAGKEESVTPIKEKEAPQKIVIPELSDNNSIPSEEASEELEISLEEPELTLEFKDELDVAMTPQTQVKPEVETEPEIQMEPELTIKQEIIDQPEYASIPEVNVETQTEKKAIYSKSKIASEIGLDMESFDELFKDFIKEANAIFTQIENAVATNDYAASKRQAIKLKGMSDNMRMHAFTTELETLIYSQDKNAILQAIKKIGNILLKISKEED